jgi:fucose permease
VTPATPRRALPAGLIGCLTLLAIGWTGLLVPSLIRSIKLSFDQSDAGIGLFYLIYSICYAAASFGGGPLTERVGRRTVLVGATVFHAAGIAGFGLAPTWLAFVLLAVPAGAGAGALDGGSNGLFLDLFRTGRGRAMNLLHLFFSIGALSAPLVAGALVEGGVPWQAVMIGTGVALVPLAIGLGVVPMPSGRRSASAPDELLSVDTAPTATGAGTGLGARLALPIILLGLAIGTYVASEVGVSNWLVRFLEPAPLSTATLALSLFWAGLAVGRLVSSQIADRFDHVRFTTASALLTAAALTGAIVSPWLPVSIALFAVCGFGSGPIFPMILAIGGERYADRSAAVSGFLTGCGVVGGTIYPPFMGVLSVTVGLTVAMAGNVLLALACAGALFAFGRRPAAATVSGAPERRAA